MLCRRLLVGLRVRWWNDARVCTELQREMPPPPLERLAQLMPAVGTFCDGSTCRGCEAADVCTSVAGSRTSCAALGVNAAEAFLRNCPSNPFRSFGV